MQPRESENATRIICEYNVRQISELFGGAVAWTYFFSDGVKERKKAAVDLGSTVHLRSTPYRCV